jgi:O-antigen/teichoic acid export membrane protein
MNQILNGYYQATLKMHIQVIGEVTGRIVLVLGLLLLIMQKASFLSVMWLIVLSSVSYTIVLWLSARKSTPAGFGFDWDIWKAIAKKMWPIAISIMFNVIYLKGDIVILSIFKSQTEVGIYGAAYRVIDILAQLAMMIMGVMLPLLAYAWSRNLKHDFRLRYQQSFDAIMLFAVPMAVGTLLLGDKIMLLVAGPKFIESGVVLKVLAFAVFWVYLGAVFGHTAVAINRQKQTIWIFLSDAVLTLIGYFIFIPLYGMHGAAWMTVFSELYAGILLFLTVRHYAQEKLRMKTLSKIIIASVIMGSLLVLFSTLHIIVLVIIGVVSYGVVLLAIGGISKETLKEISYLK